MVNSKFYIVPDKRTVTLRMIVFFLLLMCVISTKAQRYESSTCPSTSFFMSKEMTEINQQEWYKQSVYWKKHKRQRKYAFSVLGLGVCGTIAGWIGESSNTAYTNSNWKEDGKAWDVVLGVGIGLTVSSIPLFVVSRKNKKKAKKIVEFSLSNSYIHLTLPNGMKQTQNGVGITLNF